MNVIFTAGALGKCARLHAYECFYAAALLEKKRMDKALIGVK